MEAFTIGVCAFAAIASAIAVPWKYVLNLAKGDAKLESKSDTACVCVGVGKSAKYGACPGAKVDSSRMSSLLSKYGATALLQDATATASAVVSALQEACKKDLCIFFYSGHGGRVRNPKAQDGTGYSEHLCLNNGALYDYTIWDVISKAKGRVVMIFDCCHSATMFRDAGGQDFENKGFEFKLLKSLASVQGGGRNILVWSGCPSDNYSYGDDNGGWLTNGILHGYKKDRTYDEVWRRASSEAMEQHPVRTVLGDGFEGKVFR